MQSEKKKGEKKRMNFLSLDIGTTCCKSQLFSEQGEILRYSSEEYAFLEKEGEKYADIRGIFSRVKKMLADTAKEYEISSLCISSFGESFVLLDEKDELLSDPMLYTDPRGEKEAMHCWYSCFLHLRRSCFP